MEESRMDDRTRKRDILKQYYAQSPEEEVDSFDPFNINASDFNPDLYLNKLVKEYSLTELMEKESEIYRQIQCLDSEMQTLVYENYNKFISATDTIRKMKQDFKKMEEEMDLLANNMSSITKFSENISSTLQGKRDRISQLSGTHTLLKKLQFLFELPPRLKKCIEKGSYGQAVRSYLKAEAVLRQYQHMPSFQGIQEDCDVIVEELKGKLRQHFQAQEASPRQLAECVDMLLQLKEHPEQLCEDYLAHARVNLDSDLSVLEKQTELLENKKNGSSTVDLLPAGPESVGSADQMLMEAPMDVLEFVDWSCNHFLSNLCLVIASFRDMFLQRLPTQQQTKAESLTDMANGKLIFFTTDLMQRYFLLVERRLSLEEVTSETALLVRALDRFHRRLQAVNKLLPEVNFTKDGLRIVSESSRVHCGHFLKQVCAYFGQQLTCIRQGLLAPPRTSGGSGSTEGSWMANLLSSTEMALCDKLRSVLADLQAFIQPEVMFASQPTFRNNFCVQNVREGIVVAFLGHIITTVRGFCHTGKEKGNHPPPAGLVLLLSRFCLDLENSTVTYLLSMVDDQFGVEEGSSAQLTNATSLCQEMRDCAQSLLDCYVRIQGLTISQMLRKSVETRDWMSTIEPRNVRAVMKRVVEDLTSLDTVVGQLYEEGCCREQSSDSSRRTYPYSGSGAVASARPTAQHGNKSTWSNYAPSLDNSLMSNIQKLFSEKIEIFSRVEFSKVSVLTGIIKISLKTFLECVRLRTFSRHGLQQAQVDTHYLQLYLWRFVTDESLVHVLLDEIVSSTIHRCVDPVLMEPSVVEVICERG